MPKVSVLMPIYRTNPEYLSEAIQSVLSQTFSDFEFLILDDCPEDSRESIVKSYKDKRIRYIKNAKNIGITPSRNKLLDMMQGEYIAVLDHDDVCLPTRFEEEVKVLDENPKIGVVGCWVDCFPIKRELHFPSDDFRIKTLLTDICPIVHPSSMIRKSVLDKYNLRYEEDYSPSEDYCLWIRLMEHTQFYNIPKVLFKYRLHEENTSKKQQDKMNDATQRLHILVQSKYPVLYQSYLNDRTEIAYLKLFGIIPFFKIQKRYNKEKFYLFNFIPIFSLKRKRYVWPN